MAHNNRQQVKSYSKTLVLSVGCANDFADDRPNSFLCVISDQMKARIETLRNIVVAANAHSICDFNYQGDWYGACLGADLSNEELSAMTADEIEHYLKTSPIHHIEVPELHVTNEYFHWTALPKHCGSDMELVTKRVLITDLDNCLPILIHS